MLPVLTMLSAEFLRELPTCSWLSEEEVMKLAGLMLLKFYATDDVLCRQGEEANMIFFVRWGAGRLVAAFLSLFVLCSRPT